MNNKEGKSSSSESQEPKSEILIDNTSLLQGFYFCLYNSEKFFKTSKLLFDSKDYQSSIPIATISIEETMKGFELLKKFSHDQGITVENWKYLKNHKYKLTHVLEDNIQYLKSTPDKNITKTRNEVAKTGLRNDDVSIDDAIKSLQIMLARYTHFQKLRESCFYSDWDKLSEKWMIFDELPQEKQEALSFFVCEEARTSLILLKRNIERYVNRLRETGQLLKKLPYPSYEELRSPEKWESNNLLLQIQHRVDQIRFSRGIEVMNQFIELNSLQHLSLGIFRKIMHKYLKVIAKQEDTKWFPHPMIKAMMMAMSTAQEKTRKVKTSLYCQMMQIKRIVETP